MKTITTLDQWLDAALPFVIMEIEAAYEAGAYSTELHGLLLVMPCSHAWQLPKYWDITVAWNKHAPRGLGLIGFAWTPDKIAEFAVLPHLRNRTIDGDLDTLADATALAVPELVGNELCEQLLDVVQRKLDSWEWGAVEEFTGLDCEASS